MTSHSRPDFGGVYHEPPDTDLSGQVTSFVGFFCRVDRNPTAEDFVRLTRDEPEVESLRTAVGDSIGVVLTEVDIIVSLNELARTAKLQS